VDFDTIDYDIALWYSIFIPPAFAKASAGKLAEALAKAGVLIEETEHIRHAAPDNPTVIQSGQRLVLRRGSSGL